MEQFDETRFRLGKICKKGHEYNSTGKSLRYLKTPVCVICAIEYRKQRDDELRQKRKSLLPNYPEGLQKCFTCDSLIEIGTWRCKPCKKEYSKNLRQKNLTRFRERALRNARKKRVSDWHVMLWRGSRSTSKTRNLEHHISPEDILSLWEHQQGLCFWSKIPMGIDVEPSHVSRVSLDRVDSKKGYVVSNIVLTCLFINLGRRNRSAEETLWFLNQIGTSHIIG